MSSFHPSEPYSSSCDVCLSESVRVNTNNNNKGKKKKAENGKRSNNNSNSSSSSSRTTVKLSTDPQSVAARERRHRISDRFKILQSLVPGGTKMDTVSMLEEAIHYVKFLKTQIWVHQAIISSTAMDEDILHSLPPPPPPPPPPQHSVYSSAPILTMPEQPAVTQSPSLPLYFFQADENHETMFTY